MQTELIPESCLGGEVRRFLQLYADKIKRCVFLGGFFLYLSEVTLLWAIQFSKAK